MLDHQSMVDNQVTSVVCNDVDTLREALAVIAARMRAGRPDDLGKLRPDCEEDRILWMISALGVMEHDQPIGRDDTTFRGGPSDRG